MNRHLSGQPRAILLTDTHLFRLDPNEKFKSTKAPIANTDILAATITDDSSCQLVVLKVRNQDTDLVFYMECKEANSDRVPELIANIHRSIMR